MNRSEDKINCSCPKCSTMVCFSERSVNNCWDCSIELSLSKTVALCVWNVNVVRWKYHACNAARYALKVPHPCPKGSTVKACSKTMRKLPCCNKCQLETRTNKNVFNVLIVKIFLHSAFATRLTLYHLKTRAVRAPTLTATMQAPTVYAEQFLVIV